MDRREHLRREIERLLDDADERMLMMVLSFLRAA